MRLGGAYEARRVYTGVFCSSLRIVSAVSIYFCRVCLQLEINSSTEIIKRPSYNVWIAMFQSLKISTGKTINVYLTIQISRPKSHGYTCINFKVHTPYFMKSRYIFRVGVYFEIPINVTNVFVIQCLVFACMCILLCVPMPIIFAYKSSGKEIFQ